MLHLMKQRPGVGVTVTICEGFEMHYFYEDFDGPGSGIQRAMEHFYPQLNRGAITKIVFLENSQKAA